MKAAPKAATTKATRKGAKRSATDGSRLGVAQQAQVGPKQSLRAKGGPRRRPRGRWIRWISAPTYARESRASIAVITNSPHTGALRRRGSAGTTLPDREDRGRQETTPATVT